MPSLLKTNNRGANAKNFREGLGRIDPTPEYLFLYFGKDSVWTDEQNPDTPTEAVDDEFQTRNDMIGMKRITITDTAFVVPRINWQTSTVYAEYDSTDATLFSKQFYVINSNNNVYKCLDNNSGGASVVEPTGTSTTPVATGDGYTWKFMYDLSSSMISDFLTSDWLPIPTGGQRTSFQISVETNASYSVGDPVGGHGSNAVEELGARSVMLAQILDKDESGIFPINDDYRQFGLLANPRLVSDNSLATAAVYSLNDTNSDIDLTTGSLLYVDNRRIITRSAEQAENFQLVLTF